jgi:hypothetical protein
LAIFFNFFLSRKPKIYLRVKREIAFYYNNDFIKVNALRPLKLFNIVSFESRTLLICRSLPKFFSEFVVSFKQSNYKFLLVAIEEGMLVTLKKLTMVLEEFTSKIKYICIYN